MLHQDWNIDFAKEKTELCHFLLLFSILSLQMKQFCDVFKNYYSDNKTWTNNTRHYHVTGR